MTSLRTAAEHMFEAGCEPTVAALANRKQLSPPISVRELLAVLERSPFDERMIRFDSLQNGSVSAWAELFLASDGRAGLRTHVQENGLGTHRYAVYILLEPTTSAMKPMIAQHVGTVHGTLDMFGSSTDDSSSSVIQFPEVRDNWQRIRDAPAQGFLDVANGVTEALEDAVTVVLGNAAAQAVLLSL